MCVSIYYDNGRVKVAATSLKLEIRLHAQQVGTNIGSCTKAIFTLL